MSSTWNGGIVDEWGYDPDPMDYKDDSYDPYDEDDADGDVCPGCGLYFDECECEDY